MQTRETIEARLAHLERRSRIGLAAWPVNLVLVALLLAGAKQGAPTAKVVEEDVLAARVLIAEQVMVVGSLSDAENTIRVRISAEPNGNISLFDGTFPAVSLSHSSKYSGLAVQTENNRMAVGAGLVEGEPQLAIVREHTAVDLRSTEYGGMLRIKDSHGRIRAIMGVSQGGPAMGLIDEQGRSMP